ncbi:hypothetical protein ACW9HR_36880 [Nocardia gipuzkoensis]
MTIPMFGYLRLSLVGDRRCEIVDEFEALARLQGGSVHGRVFFEKGSPVQLLWSLVRQADDELDGTLVPHLQRIAAHHGIGLGQLVRGAPPTAALWTLVDALTRYEDEYTCLFVPSVQHFDELGVPKEIVLQCIARIAPRASIIYLDSGLDDSFEAGCFERLSECRPDRNREGLLVDVTVNCFADAENVVGLNTNRGLARAGLSDMVGQVDAVMRKLISAAAGDITADSNTLTIQILQPPGAAVLVVEMWESHSHNRPVSETLLGIVDVDSGGTVERCRSATGGTVTRCQLPLARTERTSEAHTVELRPLWQPFTAQFRSAS